MYSDLTLSTADTPFTLSLKRGRVAPGVRRHPLWWCRDVEYQRYSRSVNSYSLCARSVARCQSTACILNKANHQKVIPLYRIKQQHMKVVEHLPCICSIQTKSWNDRVLLLQKIKGWFLFFMILQGPRICTWLLSTNLASSQHSLSCLHSQSCSNLVAYKIISYTVMHARVDVQSSGQACWFDSTILRSRHWNEPQPGF
jgi:hypothetical protein